MPANHYISQVRSILARSGDGWRAPPMHQNTVVFADGQLFSHASQSVYACGTDKQVENTLSALAIPAD